MGDGTIIMKHVFFCIMFSYAQISSCIIILFVVVSGIHPDLSTTYSTRNFTSGVLLGSWWLSSLLLVAGRWVCGEPASSKPSLVTFYDL